MKPNSRREAFMMKHMGFDVDTPEPVTREEVLMAAAARRGETDWNASEGEAGHVKNRPFWLEYEKLPLFDGLGEITVQTADNGSFIMATGLFDFRPEVTNYVVFDGVEYECEPYYEETAGTTGIGSLDFGKYPFFITSGAIVTQTAGTHTVTQYCRSMVTKADYAPILEVATQQTEDRVPFLTVEKIEKIKNAFSNGVPIRLKTSYASVGVKMQVLDIQNLYIVASGLCPLTEEVTKQVTYRFNTSDGTLRSSSFSYLGSVNENGDTFPVMYINNKCYKITVADDGTLTATEVT